MSQRRSAIFSATGVWGGEPIGHVRVKSWGYFRQSLIQAPQIVFVILNSSSEKSVLEIIAANLQMPTAFRETETLCYSSM